MSPPLLPLLPLPLPLLAGCSGVSVKRNKPGSRRTDKRRSAIESGSLSRSRQRFRFGHRSMHSQGSIVEVMRILRLHRKETEK